MGKTHDHMQTSLTLGELIDALAEAIASGKKTRGDAVVTEGCDCEGEVGEVELTRSGAVVLLRPKYVVVEDPPVSRLGNIKKGKIAR